MADKKKLLGLLGKIKRTFNEFKKKHEDIVGEEAGESGCTERSLNETANQATIDI